MSYLAQALVEDVRNASKLFLIRDVTFNIFYQTQVRQNIGIASDKNTAITMAIQIVEKEIHTTTEYLAELKKNFLETNRIVYGFRSSIEIVEIQVNQLFPISSE